MQSTGCRIPKQPGKSWTTSKNKVVRELFSSHADADYHENRKC